MNRERRNQIKVNKNYVDRVLEILSNLTIENVRDEEQEAFDNMPEGLQGSDRGCQMEENIEELDNVVDKIDEITDMLIDIQTTLEELIEV